MDSIQREQKSDQDKYDNESRKKNELVQKIKQKEHEMEENKKRVDKLNDYIRYTCHHHLHWMKVVFFSVQYSAAISGNMIGVNCQFTHLYTLKLKHVCFFLR